MTHYTPAAWIIVKFGGVSRTARAIGRQRADVSRWKRSGTIPTKRLRIVLAEAERLHLDITPADLILGRDA